MTRWNEDKRGSWQVATEAASFDSDTAILSVEAFDGKASLERLAGNRRETTMDNEEEHDCSKGPITFVSEDGDVGCLICETKRMLARKPGDKSPERPPCRDMEDEKYSSDYCRAVDCDNMRHPGRYLCEMHMA